VHCPIFIEVDGDPILHKSTEEAFSSFTETLAVGFFAEDHLPEMTLGHDLRVQMAFRISRGEIKAPFLICRYLELQSRQPITLSPQ
jgi:hypothetical protein